MTNAVRHRGPDGAGHYVSKNVGLGHRRLAIIDLTDAAGQPMHSANRQLTIVFNGEIYNYLEIRRELKQRGHEFSTQSDTEVILASYAQWGSECVHRFNGMWAFALYDHVRNLLFCSLDRFGVKPFYYVDTPELFALGSEIKQLLDFVPRREANAAVLRTFLSTGLVDYSDSTFFEGVSKLLPGHNLFVDTLTGTLRFERYYQPAPLETACTGDQDWEQRFLETLTSSIELRLRSDVPVGTCLSGGLDSSAIATIAARKYREGGNTGFSAVTALSSDPLTDESSYARQVVDQNRLRWLTTRPTVHDFVRTIEQMSYHQDEPIPTLSPVMQYLVMEKARESGIPVLLDGQGADELLLGYPMYFAMLIRSALREGGTIAALRMLRGWLAHNHGIGLGAAIRYTLGTGMPQVRYFRSRTRCAWLKGAGLTPRVLLDGASSMRSLYQFQHNEIASATLPALLRYEDRNSMAFSVETRLPFLDYRLVELCLAMPLRNKVRDGWTKWTLRRAMNGILPDSIAWRSDKIGFEAPEAQWMQAKADMVRKTILDSQLVRAVTHERALKPALSWMSARERWRLFSLAIWSGQFGVAAIAEPAPEEITLPDRSMSEVTACRAESVDC